MLMYHIPHTHRYRYHRHYLESDLYKIFILANIRALVFALIWQSQKERRISLLCIHFWPLKNYSCFMMMADMKQFTQLLNYMKLIILNGVRYVFIDVKHIYIFIYMYICIYLCLCTWIEKKITSKDSNIPSISSSLSVFTEYFMCGIWTIFRSL